MVCGRSNWRLIGWSARWGRTAAHLALLLALGCDSPAEEAEPTPQEPPLCSAVPLFGNGASCEPATGGAPDAALKACGTATRRTCASGWLCFDAPEYADCRCTSDGDCSGRTAYINAGRTAAGKAPLASNCDAGRCAGAP